MKRKTSCMNMTRHFTKQKTQSMIHGELVMTSLIHHHDTWRVGDDITYSPSSVGQYSLPSAPGRVACKHTEFELERSDVREENSISNSKQVKIAPHRSLRKILLRGDIGRVCCRSHTIHSIALQLRNSQGFIPDIVWQIDWKNCRAMKWSRQHLPHSTPKLANTTVGST